MGGGRGQGGCCFECGQPGHVDRNCPSRLLRDSLARGVMIPGGQPPKNTVISGFGAQGGAFESGGRRFLRLAAEAPDGADLLHNMTSSNSAKRNAAKLLREALAE